MDTTSKYMQNENTKFIPRTQMQTILDNAPQGVDKKALIDKFVSDGFVVEGVNEPKPNLAQSIVGGLIKAPTDLAATGFASIGALGSYAGKKLAGQETTLGQEYAAQSEQVKGSGLNQMIQPLTGQEIRPAQNLEQLGGDVIQTAAIAAPGATVARGALSGAGLLGGMAMSEDKDLMEVAKQAGIGAVTGGALTAIIPGLAKLAAATKGLEKEIQTGLSKGIKSDEIAASLLTKQNKITPTDRRNFISMSDGLDDGQYLVSKGIIDTPEETVNKLAKDYYNSYKIKKENLALLPNQYTFYPANEALNELIQYEAKTAVKGVKGKFTDKINRLTEASKTRGLTVDEIDDIKNMYENTVALGYGREINSAGIDKAQKIDKALREFVEDKAAEQGFTNIRELNKNTQLSRFLADAIEKSVSGRAGNNILSLTDTIIGSAATIDPSALIVLAGKKLASSEKIRAGIAKRLTKSIPKDIKAEVSQSTKALLNPATNKVETDFLVAPAGSKTGAFESATKKIATSGQRTNPGKSQVQSQVLNQSSTESLPQTTKKASGKMGGFVDIGTGKQYDATKFTNFKDVSTKILSKLEGRDKVSKQFILDLTNSGDVKQVEKELIRSLLQGEGEKVNVVDFANKVKAELLPLKVSGDILKGETLTRYEGVVLPDELRGNVKDYTEKIYESPIKTSAGGKHFGDSPMGDEGGVENYFGHTRIEDMADNKTRRVIEVQSDLYQKGNLEKELPRSNMYMGQTYTPLSEKFDKNTGKILTTIKLKNGEVVQVASEELNAKVGKRVNEIQKLQQYNNPTAHFRMVREEIKKAAKDGKAKLQFPTGETAMKIEGLGQRDFWLRIMPGGQAIGDLTPTEMEVGQLIKNTEGSSNYWIITDVLGDGKFKAVPKDKLENMIEDSGIAFDTIETNDAINYANQHTPETMGLHSESFDISGKVDTNNPIYKFYNKELSNYLKNNYKATEVTDKQGVTWLEVNIDSSMADKPVNAFSISPLFLGAGGTAAGVGGVKGLTEYQKSKNSKK